MKKIVAYVCIVLFSAVAISCNKYEYKPSHFISTYVIPQRVNINNSGNGKEISIQFYGKTLHKGEQFEELARLNNDSYNKKRMDYPVRAFAMALNSIKIISAQDFDAQHSAGTDISDLVECRYNSWYKYVHDKFQGEPFNYTTSVCKAISTSVTDLMEPLLWFSFLQKPATPGTYTFDLIFTFENSEVKGHITCEFK